MTTSKPEHTCGVTGFEDAYLATCPACEPFNKAAAERALQYRASIGLEENPETSWVDENGHALPDIHVESTFEQALPDEQQLKQLYTEYVTMCSNADTLPMTQDNWEAARQNKIDKFRDYVNLPTFKLNMLTPDQVKIEELESQRDRAIFFKNQAEQKTAEVERELAARQTELQNTCNEVYSLRSEIEKFENEKDINSELRQAVDNLGRSLTVAEEHVRVVDAENARLIRVLKSAEDLTHAKKPTTPSNQPLFPHYFRETPNSTHIDIYWFLKAFDVTCPSTQHAIKKLFAAGLRGAKNRVKDLQEARDSITRALELEDV